MSLSFDTLISDGPENHSLFFFFFLIKPDHSLMLLPHKKRRTMDEQGHPQGELKILHFPVNAKDLCVAQSLFVECTFYSGATSAEIHFYHSGVLRPCTFRSPQYYPTSVSEIIIGHSRMQATKLEDFMSQLSFHLGYQVKVVHEYHRASLHNHPPMLMYRRVRVSPLVNPRYNKSKNDPCHIPSLKELCLNRIVNKKVRIAIPTVWKYRTDFRMRYWGENPFHPTKFTDVPPLVLLAWHTLLNTEPFDKGLGQIDEYFNGDIENFLMQFGIPIVIYDQKGRLRHCTEKVKDDLFKCPRIWLNTDKHCELYRQAVDQYFKTYVLPVAVQIAKWRQERISCSGYMGCWFHQSNPVPCPYLWKDSRLPYRYIPEKGKEDKRCDVCGIVVVKRNTRMAMEAERLLQNSLLNQEFRTFNPVPWQIFSTEQYDERFNAESDVSKTTIDVIYKSREAKAHYWIHNIYCKRLDWLMNDVSASILDLLDTTRGFRPPPDRERYTRLYSITRMRLDVIYNISMILKMRLQRTNDFPFKDVFAFLIKFAYGPFEMTAFPNLEVLRKCGIMPRFPNETHLEIECMRHTVDLLRQFIIDMMMLHFGLPTFHNTDVWEKLQWEWIHENPKPELATEKVKEMEDSMHKIIKDMAMERIAQEFRRCSRALDQEAPNKQPDEEAMPELEEATTSASSTTEDYSTVSDCDSLDDEYTQL